MKINIKYLLLTFLLIVIGIKGVSADGVYSGKLYEVWHPDSGFTVFASESNGFMDYNSWMIKSTTDNKIYYCIDPATPLEGSYVGSHRLITGKNNIINSTAFTDKKFDRVQLLAYYGYGYKDNFVDHTDKKWYGITQVMIWRVMRPDLTWTFKATRNSNPNPMLYSKEVKELNDLVDSYSLLPSFSNSTIELVRGTSTTLKDSNGVLYKYDFYGKNKKLDISLNGNNMTITSDAEPGEYYSSFTVPLKTNDKFGALVSSDFQDLIVMGQPNIQVFGLTVKLTGGIINLQKVDKNTEKSKPQGDASFSDAIYGVYDNDGKKIGTITTDKDGKGRIGVPYGEYTLKEIKAPLGYKLSDKVYSVSVTKDNYDINTYVSDEVITGKIKLVKMKGGSGEDFSLEENATFDVIDSHDEIIQTLKTNEKGMAITVLPYGKYTLKQTGGNSSYVFSDDISLNIDQDRIYEFDVKNLRKSKLVFSKSDFSTDLPVPDALIEIYKDDDTLIYSGKTDKDGMIIVPDLDIGKYYILEKEAPKYYRLNEEKMYFEVKNNGEVVKANMKNYRNEGSLKIIKKDFSNNLLSGVSFDIYFMENNKLMFKAVTDSNGQINIDKLIAGKYCAREVKTLKGYRLLDNDVCFEIVDDNQNIELIIKNSKEYIIPDTKDIDIIPFVSIFMIICSCLYYVREKSF